VGQSPPSVFFAINRLQLDERAGIDNKSTVHYEIKPTEGSLVSCGGYQKER
jgi:hypothetical protein